MELIAQHFGQDLIPFIDPKDRLRDLTPAQRLQGLSFEDIVNRLSDEERQALRELLDDPKSDT